ncbi:alpha/beta hydrolase [Streptomyces sp. NPDC056296]|uniref:alpha/beta hydrolase n=1 Tax=Streptomyces sp. NPDC056296 TaxID=3345775 RepID=UPI0035DE6E3B
MATVQVNRRGGSSVLLTSSKTRIAVAAVIALLLGAVSAPRADAAGQGQEIAWAPCASDAAFECGTFEVPLDYRALDGGRIDVALIRRPAADPARRIGSLVFNPGGPGASGIDALMSAYSLFPAETRARFDIVSFDPRGTGRSTPLTCFADPAEEAALLSRTPAGFPVGPEERQKWISAYARYGEACEEHGGPVISHMSTANVARDMDRLRGELGEDRISYYGTSYGTYLGATYANLFPSRVRVMVLDANVPPSQWNDERAGATHGTFLRLNSHAGTEAALRQFLNRCGQAGTGRCAFTAGRPSATLVKYRTLLDRLRAAPVDIGGQTFTYASTVTTVGFSLAQQDPVPGVPGTGWKGLAGLLQTLWVATTSGATTTLGTTDGPPAPGGWPTLLGAATPGAPAGTYGVLCSDSPNPRNPLSYQYQARVADRLAPHGFGSLWAWTAEPCAHWPVTDRDRYTGPFDKETAPLLLIGNTLDPNTPYANSLAMSRELANARLLTVDGSGHTALLNKSSCADDYIDDYLTGKALPPPGTRCAQDQQPF